MSILVAGGLVVFGFVLGSIGSLIANYSLSRTLRNLQK